MRERHSSCRGVSGEGTGPRSAKSGSVARHIRLIASKLFQCRPPFNLLVQVLIFTARHSSWLAIPAEPAGAHGRGQPGVYATPWCAATVEVSFLTRSSCQASLTPWAHNRSETSKVTGQSVSGPGRWLTMIAPWPLRVRRRSSAATNSAAVRRSRPSVGSSSSSQGAGRR
jgi:hypothetical protein